MNGQNETFATRNPLPVRARRAESQPAAHAPRGASADAHGDASRVRAEERASSRHRSGGVERERKARAARDVIRELGVGRARATTRNARDGGVG